MLGLVFGTVLLAAAVHAGWNALIKGAVDTLLTTILVSAGAGLTAIAALPFMTRPAPASWPFLLASAVLQVAYYTLVAQAYRLADMSQSYPVMRGTAPLLVALASVLWLGESLSLAAWTGVGAICAGVLAMTAGNRRRTEGGLKVALLNAVVIASYTLIDGAGVRRSGAPLAYTMWVFLLTAIPLTSWALAAKGAPFVAYARRYGHLGLLGGIGSIASYGAALWAMTLAPVPVIAALRETSILFGTAISALVLKERIGTARITAVGLIVLGALVLRLA